jgi:hypothetical protein
VLKIEWENWWILYDERVVKIGENGVFIDNMIDLLKPDDLSFLEDFESDVLIGILFLR